MILSLTDFLSCSSETAAGGLSLTDFTDYTDIIWATAAQPRLIITGLPQLMTAARPERSNARAERVARSRGGGEA